MDPIERNHVTVGERISLLRAAAEGPSDGIGVVEELTETAVVLMRRDGTRMTVPRAEIRTVRRVPLVARGRNPHHFDPELVRQMAHDERGGGSGPVRIARLCDLIDSLDVTGVSDGDPARCGASTARVFGEWAAIHLADPADLAPLGAWAARRNARNVAITGVGDAGDRLGPVI